MKEVEMPSVRRVSIACCLMQIGFWGMLGAFAGFETAVFLDRGFTSGQAGIFIALGYLAGLIVEVVWHFRLLHIIVILNQICF